MPEMYVAFGDQCLVIEADTMEEARLRAFAIARHRVNGDPEPELPCEADRRDERWAVKMNLLRMASRGSA